MACLRNVIKNRFSRINPVNHLLKANIIDIDIRQIDQVSGIGRLRLSEVCDCLSHSK